MFLFRWDESVNPVAAGRRSHPRIRPSWPISMRQARRLLPDRGAVAARDHTFGRPPGAPRPRACSGVARQSTARDDRRGAGAARLVSAYRSHAVGGWARGGAAPARRIAATGEAHVGAEVQARPVNRPSMQRSNQLSFVLTYAQSAASASKVDECRVSISAKLLNRAPFGITGRVSPTQLIPRTCGPAPAAIASSAP
jgi:hypothetical protein